MAFKAYKRAIAKRRTNGAALNSELPDEFRAMVNVEVLPIDSLRLAKMNPRQHSAANVDKIAQSIRTYGWTTPIFVSDQLEVIAGHGRLYAARKLGITEAPCIRLSHLSPKLVESYRIADNRLGLDSDWDEDILGSVLQGLNDGTEWEELFTGFDKIEVISRLGLEVDPWQEWGGMPEFEHGEKAAFRSIMVHFNDQNGVDQFAALVDSTITAKTKYIWFPKVDRTDNSGVRYKSKKK
jgi:ParB-like nuclease domain